MSVSTKASQAYLKSAVMTASQEQLHLMLLDGAIRFTSRGREALLKEDIEGAFNGFERAQRIVLELSNGLRREANPDLVDQMSALYDFIYRRLIDANVHREIEGADDSLRILRHQRETWMMLIEKLARESGEPAVNPPNQPSVAVAPGLPPAMGGGSPGPVAGESTLSIEG